MQTHRKEPRGRPGAQVEEVSTGFATADPGRPAPWGVTSHEAMMWKATKSGCDTFGLTVPASQLLSKQLPATLSAATLISSNCFPFFPDLEGDHLWKGVRGIFTLRTWRWEDLQV